MLGGDNGCRLSSTSRLSPDDSSRNGVPVCGFKRSALGLESLLFGNAILVEPGILYAFSKDRQRASRSLLLRQSN